MCGFELIIMEGPCETFNEKISAQMRSKSQMNHFETQNDCWSGLGGLVLLQCKFLLLLLF